MKENLEHFDLTDKATIIKADVFDLDVKIFDEIKKDENDNEKNNENTKNSKEVVELESIKTNNITKTNNEDQPILEEKVLNSKPFDYCLTNPPFGIQSITNADAKFLDVACKITEEAIFSIHKAVTFDFLNKFLQERNFIVQEKTNFLFDIPKTYKFHKDSVRNIEVVFIDAVSDEYIQ